MPDMISKDLGPVSGYAIAVAHGYTGTEAQWIEEVLKGTQNAQTATQKAAEAAQSANTASQSATSASNSATTATQKASEAASSATAASGSATNAANSATTATQQATAASGSATAAANSASEAQEVLDSIPEDYTELSEDVSDLKSSLMNLGISDYREFVHTGYIDSSTNKWVRIGNESYHHAAIPVNGGESFKLIGTVSGGGTSYFAALASYNNPAVGDPADYSTASGWTGTRSIGVGGTVIDTLPADARFLYVYLRSNASGNPQHIYIDGYDYMVDAKTNIVNAANTANENVRGIDLLFNRTLPAIRSVSHSGYHVSAPENSIPAFKDSKLHNFDWIECDLQYTSDGVGVLCHNDAINDYARNPDGTEIANTVNISESTYNDLLYYDFGIQKGQEYAGLKITTLEQLMDLCRAIKLSARIELKRTSTYTTANLTNLRDMAVKYNMLHRIEIASDYYTHLQAVHSLDDSIDICYICSAISAVIVSNAKKITSSNRVTIATSYTDSAANIALAKAEGIPVDAWTVTTAADILSVDPYVTSFTTNVLKAEDVLFEDADVPGGYPSVDAKVDDLKATVSILDSSIDDIEGALFEKVTLADLTDSGTYIDTNGAKVATALQIATSPMYDANGLQKVILSKTGLPMTALSVAFYTSDTFGSASFISGYNSQVETEENTSIDVPAGARYVAFCSRTVEGFTFDAKLVFATKDTLSALQTAVDSLEADVTAISANTDMLNDFVTDEQNIISYPPSTTNTTNPANIFAIAKILSPGYYRVSFISTSDVTLYVFNLNALTDTVLTLEKVITKSPSGGTVVFDSVSIENKSIIGLSGMVRYRPSNVNGYYNVTYANDAYTKPDSFSGKVDFNVAVDMLISKIMDSSAPVFGIPFIAPATETTHIKLIGDSITQGSGSTGYVEFTLNDNIYRGNAPDYPDAGAGYQVGKFLGTKETIIHWYEAIDGSGWGQLFKAYLESKFNCTVKNYGMGGATTSDILRCWDNIIDDDDDIVILMVGTNDRRSHSITAYYSELTTIVINLLNEGKRVFVMSPPPILPSVDASSQYFHMEDACNYSSAVAYSKECQFIDNFGYIEEYCSVKGVGLNTLLNSDGIHPNDTGYRVLFGNIVKELRLGRKVDGATW